MRWLALGLWVGVGLTLARWVTMEPWAPVHLPIDLACALLWTGGAAWLARGAPAPRLAWASMALPLVWIWASALGDAPLSLRGKGAAGLAAGIGLLLLARRRDPPAAWCPAALAILLAAGLAGADATRAAWLVLPAALVLVARAPAASDRPRWGLAASLASVLLVVLLSVPVPGARGRFDPAVATPPKPGPAVVLIVLDTLRRQQLSFHGYPRETSPALARLAPQALVFEAATATSSWTLPSHASIFTGLSPRQHGAHGYRGKAPLGNAWPLADRFETLAERVHDAGFATGAVVANHFYLGPRYGLDQGFDTYWAPSPRAGLQLPGLDALTATFRPHALGRVRWPYYRAEQITDRALAWIDARGAAGFLLFVNYMDVHAPNRGSPDPRVPPADEQSPQEASFDLDRVPEGVPIPPAVHRHLVNAYDRELLDLDRELGRLLDTVRRGSLGERTTVIVTSDHGEYFGEHSLIDHSRDLHEEVLGVPLLVAGPGIPPGRRHEPVSLSSLHPTVLARMGLPADAPTLLDGAETGPVSAEWHASEHALHLDPRYGGRFDRDVWVHRRGSYKLFRDDRGGRQVFDLEEDPNEQRDLSEARSELRAELEAELDAWLASRPAAPAAGTPADPQLSREEREQLEALGYAE